MKQRIFRTYVPTYVSFSPETRFPRERYRFGRVIDRDRCKWASRVQKRVECPPMPSFFYTPLDSLTAATHMSNDVLYDRRTHYGLLQLRKHSTFLINHNVLHFPRGKKVDRTIKFTLKIDHKMNTQRTLSRTL